MFSFLLFSGENLQFLILPGPFFCWFFFLFVCFKTGNDKWKRGEPRVGWRAELLLLSFFNTRAPLHTKDRDILLAISFQPPGSVLEGEGVKWLHLKMIEKQSSLFWLLFIWGEVESGFFFFSILKNY